MHEQDSETTQIELQKLNDLQTAIVLHAERKCRKLKTREVPYAPEDVQRFGKENTLMVDDYIEKIWKKS